MYEASEVIKDIEDILEDSSVYIKTYKIIKLWIRLENTSKKKGADKDSEISKLINLTPSVIYRIRVLRNSIVHFNVKHKEYNTVYKIDNGLFVDFDEEILKDKIDNTLNLIKLDISIEGEFDNNE